MNAREWTRRGIDAVHSGLAFMATFGAAGILAALLCRLLRPLLLRYALARPNARSSHVVPTPQGGGIAVVLGMLGALGIALTATAPGTAESVARSAFIASQLMPLLVVGLGSVILGIIGAWDDIRPLPALPRLALQTGAVALVVFGAAPDLRLLPEPMPLAAERALAVLAGVWFVNLTNFMDGLDWLTVAAVLPAALTLALIAHQGGLDPGTGLLAAALAGAMAGFAPLNRPVARLFLGDVGSLPIGLLMAYLLYRLAGTGALAAAMLLPLYSVCDATLTLFRRLLRGERVWEAHRSHFYQQATANGFSTLAVAGHVLGLNLLLCGLALFAIARPTLSAQMMALALGFALTFALMGRFARKRPASAVPAR
jgi:UDP-N-acetylmuramyl pentapeptide phosphotransferase/UDP-N-acetylglucosamine-1-phosphate transferase